MPKVNDIVTLAAALEKSPLSISQDRCVCVRNRNATCRKCVEACAVSAIGVSGNEVRLEISACTGCGACVSACPTEALVALDPTDASLCEALIGSMDEGGSPAIMACARIAARHLVDPGAFAEVPCLARLHERDVLVAVAQGAGGVLLVDGDCATCKYGASTASLGEIVDGANALLEGRGVSQRVRRSSSFPDELLLESTEGVFGSTRRGFFSDAAAAARETTLSAAKATLDEKLGTNKAPGIGERLRVSDAGTLPQYAMPRHDQLIDALDALGLPQDVEVTSRLFASVDIDTSTCNACGMCAMFCPTGALRRGESGRRVDDLKTLEFSACECVQCRLCADVCWKGSLSIDEAVSAEELFDFEPVVFDLSGAQRQAKSLFGKA